MEYLTVHFNSDVSVPEGHFGDLPENSFRGLGVTFGGRIDSWVPTFMEKGAFTKTLQEAGKRVKILWQHDDRAPIGVPTHMCELDAGLCLEAKISLTAQGKDALQLIRDKVVDGLSIGFDAIKEEIIHLPSGGVERHIKEVKLYEISPVTWGADEKARITEVNSLGKLDIFGATPFGNLPLYPRNYAWKKSEADVGVREWAGAEEEPNAKYRKAFMWYDPADAKNFKAYKLPFAEVTDGELRAVPRAVFAVAAVLSGARGGVSIPEDDKEKVKRHVERYYAKMRKEFDDDSIIVPWESETQLALSNYEVVDALFLLGTLLQNGLTATGASEALRVINTPDSTSREVCIEDNSETLLLEADLLIAEWSLEAVLTS